MNILGAVGNKSGKTGGKKLEFQAGDVETLEMSASHFGVSRFKSWLFYFQFQASC